VRGEGWGEGVCPRIPEEPNRPATVLLFPFDELLMLPEWSKVQDFVFRIDSESKGLETTSPITHHPSPTTHHPSPSTHHLHYYKQEIVYIGVGWPTTQ
jgi:hypothetical protein